MPVRRGCGRARNQVTYLLDGRSLGDGSAKRGIGTYLRGLLDAYSTLGIGASVSLLLERDSEVPDLVHAAGFTVHRRRLRALNRHLRPLLDPFLVRHALGVDPPALYHSVEYAQPVIPRLPVVVTVHDLIPFVLPRSYPWMRRERFLAMRQLRHADAVIAVSHATAADLQRIAGVEGSRISVIAEGVSQSVTAALPPEALTELRRRLQLPERFVLAVGTFDPRKRIDALSDTVRHLRVEHDVGLVLAGFQGDFAPTVTRSLGRFGIESCTRVVGHLDDQDLAGLYQMSECLLFTSAYEGFGLPPLEAMAAGLPVVAFDNSSLPEVVGEAGVLVADGDAAAMAAAASRILGDPRERQRRVAAGRARAASFTWERTALATLAVYQRVLDTR
jgi:glycosyltransferase involved in cell wall biosynthesis